MTYTIDLTGQTYNSWQVLEFAGKDRGNKSMWKCKCTGCGVEKTIDSYNLRSGRSKSCRKCSAKIVVETVHKTHGLSKTKLYRAWASMKTRCYNEAQGNTYKHHGKLGVSVWEGWINDFEAFAEHIGEPPTPLHTVDRIDPFGNYEPGNVRWATQSEQMNNTRRSPQHRERRDNLAKFGEASDF